MDHQVLLVSLFILLLLSLCVCEGRRPLRKRTVSEVQLMHNLGERKQVQDRREWLQTRLRSLHTAAARSGGPEAPRGPRHRPVPGAPELSPEEITAALSFLEKMLQLKHT